MKGFRNDSLRIFVAFIWKEIRKGVQLNRGMGKLISIVRGSREMKRFRNDSLSIFGAFIWKEIRKGAEIKWRNGKANFNR